MILHSSNIRHYNFTDANDVDLEYPSQYGTHTLEVLKPTRVLRKEDRYFLFDRVLGQVPITPYLLKDYDSWIGATAKTIKMGGIKTVNWQILWKEGFLKDGENGEDDEGMEFPAVERIYWNGIWNLCDYWAKVTSPGREDDQNVGRRTVHCEIKPS